MPKKTERGDPLGFFNIQSVGKYQKNEGGPFDEKNFRKKVSESRKYSKEVPFGPVEFLDDVKIYLRKLSKNCKKLRNCKIVRIVRKVDHSE